MSPGLCAPAVVGKAEDSKSAEEPALNGAAAYRGWRERPSVGLRGPFRFRVRKQPIELLLSVDHFLERGVNPSKRDVLQKIDQNKTSRQGGILGRNCLPLRLHRAAP